MVCPLEPWGDRTEIPARSVFALFTQEAGGWTASALPLEATIGEPGSETPATVTAVRRMVDGFLLRLEGVSTREGAASLTGRKLWLPRTTLPPLGAGEFYVEDLRRMPGRRPRGTPSSALCAAFSGTEATTSW